MRVFSSATGLSHFEDTGEANADGLGASVLGPGDLDGDGVPDVVYGAPGEGDGQQTIQIDIGAVYAGSVGTDQTLWHVIGDVELGAFGSALAAPGDVDLDGVPDVVVAASGNQPSARVLSGATGAMISWSPAPRPYEDYATSVAGAGDVNGDGLPDVAVGSPLAPGGGRIDLVDGATAALLGSFDHAEVGAWALGAALDGPADVNADGIADLVAGALDTSHPWDSGRALLVSARDVPWQHLGHALPGASGAPLLRAEGLPRADHEVTLRVAGGPSLALSWLLVGEGASYRPAFGGGIVPTVDTLLPLLLDATGRGVLSGRWPGLPPTVDATFQAWIADPSGPAGWTASNGLAAGP